MNIAVLGRTGMLYQATLDLIAKGHSIKLIVTSKDLVKIPGAVRILIILLWMSQLNIYLLRE